MKEDTPSCESACLTEAFFPGLAAVEFRRNKATNGVKLSGLAAASTVRGGKHIAGAGAGAASAGVGAGTVRSTCRCSLLFFCLGFGFRLLALFFPIRHSRDKQAKAEPEAWEYMDSRGLLMAPSVPSLGQV